MSNNDKLTSITNTDDLNHLTQYWSAKTNSIYDAVGDSFLQAQNDAYVLGFKRGQMKSSALIQALRELHAQVSNESAENKEPGISTAIGRAQVVDEINAILTKYAG
ncbi:hypothetical protein RP726_05250 [Candidatus Methylospira mobilis]|uniref:hypothetical protein n=1 Tax=Candidatus Methylospira mobilis TaxID=1808979 RepID=UPI0028EB3453|nr:hypothetical protein [Candidatus Methylospira mobilis]WNV05825.1 hypothetical protein RP726_05250 [Candidatus Methylospira mobilis]